MVEIDGELLAAVGIDDDWVIADPFQRTAAIVDLLRVRARQLRPVARTDRATRSDSQRASSAANHRRRRALRLCEVPTAAQRRESAGAKSET